MTCFSSVDMSTRSSSISQTENSLVRRQEATVEDSDESHKITPHNFHDKFTKTVMVLKQAHARLSESLFIKQRTI